MKYFKFGLVGVTVLLTMSAIAGPREEIESRIKPIGQVQVSGDESSKISLPEDAEASVKPSIMTGEDVYNKYCVVCHSVGVAGAPKLQDKATWSSRQSKGIDGLLKTAIKGVNAMPPKGTCMTCSDDELKAAITYMLPK